MQLYDYFRSSAAFRVRITLNIKNLDYERIAVNLLEGEQRQADYREKNPQGLVPMLVDGERRLFQSIAICEYLEENFPEPAILPTDSPGRARVRALAQLVAADIHPVNNLRILNYLIDELNVGNDVRLEWIHHWIGEGFAALESHLASSETGRFCHGDTVTLADICLVPQVFNARRFECDLAPYPRLVGIADRCSAQEAFARAAP